MKPEVLINEMIAAPYVEGGRSLNGFDCFGLVEIWHEVILGIIIHDRGKHPGGSSGLTSGYKDQKDWEELAEPQDHAVVMMRSLFNGRICNFGHCGVFFQGNVLHMEANSGFRCDSWSDRLISSRCSALRIHRKLCHQ